MAQLRRQADEIAARGAAVLVVGPEGPGAFGDYWKANGMPFVGLPDPEHRVLRAFGQQVKLFKLGRMPAQVLIDRQGMVRFVHYGHSMSDIPPPDEILALLDRLNAAGEAATGA